MTSITDMSAMLSVLVSVVVLISVLYSLWWSKKLGAQLGAVTSKVFGFLGQSGVDKKEIKAIEKLASEDLQTAMMAQYPEIELIIGWLSPPTLERIKENPQALPILAARWMPVAKQLLSIAGKGQSVQQVYDFE